MVSFVNWLKHRVVRQRTTLIEFDCRGCMADDWREVQRGTIVDIIQKNVTNGPPIGCYLVQREDGVIFEAIWPWCQPGLEEMQARTDNPEESLVGKIVCLH